MSMTRQDIKDLISLNTQMYGRGFKYDVQIKKEGESGFSWVNSMTELKNEAEVGDEVRIDVLTGHQSRYDRGHCYDVLRFEIEDSDRAHRRIEEYRESKNSTNVIYKDPQDNQKQTLYNWERGSIDNFKGDRFDTLEEAKNFVEKIFDDLDLTPPHLKYHAGRTRSCSYFRIFHEIRIGDWGFSKAVLIHESVHGIVAQLGVERFVAAHGPLFLGIYIELLDKYLDYCDKEELKIDASYHYDLEFIEDPDLDYWKGLQENELEVDLSDINRLRKTEYVSTDGTELTENQKGVLFQIHNDNEESVDGRSAGALIRRNLLKKNGGGYELTEKGENAIQILSNN